MKIEWDAIDWNYVNLDSRPDRLAHAEVEFARHGIKPSRFTALDLRGSMSAHHARMRARTPGAIGCFESQLSVIRGGNEGRITAVCEDDVVFCDDLRARIDYLSVHVPSDWDIVFLGATFHCNPAVWHKSTLGMDATGCKTGIARTFGIWSTHSYLVNPTSRNRIIAILLENMGRSDGIDDCMIKFVEPFINSYCMVPGIAKQYDNQSNIGRGITHFSHFVSLGPYWWQPRMEMFDPSTFNWGEAQ